MTKRRTGLSSMKSSTHHKPRRIPSTPAKAMTPQLKRENNANHSTRKSNVEALDGKRSSPKSLRALLSLGSFRENDKESTFTNKKSESSALAHSSSRTPKDCPTPFKTPAPVIHFSCFFRILEFNVMILNFNLDLIAGIYKEYLLIHCSHPTN